MAALPFEPTGDPELLSLFVAADLRRQGIGSHLVALVEEGRLPREEAYAIVQRNALRAADERRPLHDLLATDARVAECLTLARLEACFDDAGFLAHVPTLIARLDSIDPGIVR